jgi:hypothetical protein
MDHTSGQVGPARTKKRRKEKVSNLDRRVFEGADNLTISIDLKTERKLDVVE